MAEENKSSLIQDIGGLGEVANSKLANKAYDDAVSSPAKKTGDILTQALNVVGFPIELLSNCKDRIAEFVFEAEKKVPKDRKIPIDPELLGAILPKLPFISDKNFLRKQFLNLLSSSMDSVKNRYAHPMFVGILSSLSKLDAEFLIQIKQSNGISGDISLGRQIVYRSSNQDLIKEMKAKHIESRYQRAAADLLRFSEQFEGWEYLDLCICMETLSQNGLIEIAFHTLGKDSESVDYVRIKLTTIGFLFSRACIDSD